MHCAPVHGAPCMVLTPVQGAGCVVRPRQCTDCHSPAAKISKRISPSAYMSVFVDAGAPASCSGGMYCGLPAMSAPASAAAIPSVRQAVDEIVDAEFVRFVR